MKESKYGSVEHRKGVTFITPGVDEIDLPTPVKSDRTPMEILRDGFERGRFENQMRGTKVLNIEPNHMPHVHDFWKLRLQRADGGKILMQRACASRTVDGVEFAGCGAAESFDLLPELEARRLFRRMKQTA